MRVNARLDETAQRQLEYLARSTGQSVSHLVRESVAACCAQQRAQGAVPSRFLAPAGSGHSGRSDVACTVKRELDAALADKHRAART